MTVTEPALRDVLVIVHVDIRAPHHWDRHQYAGQRAARARRTDEKEADAITQTAGCALTQAARRFPSTPQWGNRRRLAGCGEGGAHDGGSQGMGDSRN